MTTQELEAMPGYVTDVDQDVAFEQNPSYYVYDRAIYNYGNDRLKEKYLPKLSSGDYVGCFGLTEPDFGSDPSSMTTKAVKSNDQYILNGNKTWISNSPIADVFVVWAKHDNIVKGFVLDRGMKGITTPKIEGKLSLRTSVTGMINLDDVKVPKENVLDVEGMRGPFSCLNNFVYLDQTNL